jgi:hypothetical protein
VTRPDPFAPVIALDLDGTSGDYHGHFTRFAAEYVGRPMPDPAQYTGGVHFSKHLGVSRSTYNTMKLAYRQGGQKRSMPVYDGIGDFTRYVRKCGVQVWICTTRPYLRLDNIDPDTRHWVTKRAHMQYDAILYGPHKYRDLARAVGVERVVMVYDDLPSLVEQALGLGMPATLRLQPYNQYWVRNLKQQHVPRSDTLFVAGSVTAYREVFDAALHDWRGKHDKVRPQP